MALTADYLYTYTLRLMKKNMAGGLKSTDFNAHWSESQRAYQDDLMGRFQARNNGKEGLNTGLIENETILQKLSPFITPIVLTFTDGICEKPKDFIYRLALRSNGKDCYKINHDQIATVNDSVIDPPSIDDDRYYFVEYEGYYLFLPIETATADLDYISTPKDIKWGFTFDEQGRQVYSIGLSVQPLWDNNSCMEITKRMFKTLGVSFKDSDFENFGESVIDKGV